MSLSVKYFIISNNKVSHINHCVVTGTHLIKENPPRPFVY